MTMTDERMAMIELVEKQSDGDLVREMLALAAERIMEAEVEVRTGATSPISRRRPRTVTRSQHCAPQSGRWLSQSPPPSANFPGGADRTFAAKSRCKARVIQTTYLSSHNM